MKDARTNASAALFLADIIEIYRKHGLSLGHEDEHGAFVVEPLADINVSWLNDALLHPEVKDYDSPPEIKPVV